MRKQHQQQAEMLQAARRETAEERPVLVGEAMKNRRSHLRIPIATVAHLSPHGFHVSTQVFVRDISVHGMGGYAIVPHRKGEWLQVHLKIDRLYKGPIRGVVRGEIRWSNPVDQGKRFAFGLQFREPDMAREQPLLYRYLKELEELFHPH